MLWICTVVSMMCGTTGNCMVFRRELDYVNSTRFESFTHKSLENTAQTLQESSTCTASKRRLIDHFILIVRVKVPFNQSDRQKRYE